MQSSFFQNENRHRLIEYDLYESCLKRQLFYTKWCWAVIASALSGQNERSYPDDRKKKGVEMIYQVTALVILAVFYGCYFLKMLMQQRKGIRTDQIGQGKVGFVKFVEVISILLNTTCFWAPFRICGAVIGALGATVFVTSVVTMRDSWRAGVSKTDKTELVTDGIYQISRNPAFLGFDLVYIGILLMFFNPWLLIASVFAMLMFHLQIVNVEEDFLLETFGQEYLAYKKKVNRYIGRK